MESVKKKDKPKGLEPLDKHKIHFFFNQHTNKFILDLSVKDTEFLFFFFLINCVPFLLLVSSFYMLWSHFVFPLDLRQICLWGLVRVMAHLVRCILVRVILSSRFVFLQLALLLSSALVFSVLCAFVSCQYAILLVNFFFLLVLSLF